MNRNQRRAAWAKNGWAPLEPATRVPLTEAQIAEHIAHALKIMPSADPAELRRLCAEEQGEMWKNARYTVHVIRWPRQGPRGVDIVQLSIRRDDRAPARDWRDFQRIKNQLIGEECEAVELYPAESRLVDTATQYHLWAVPDPTFRWPIGYTSRVVSSESSGGSVQRPLDPFDIAAEEA